MSLLTAVAHRWIKKSGARLFFSPSIRSTTLFAALFLVLAIPSYSQQAATADFDQAYKALAKKDYDSAISHFQKGLQQQPANAGVHKDLAYALLKTGENADARDEFESALKLNPNDESAALEFAFLAYETKKPVEARRMFDRLRKSGSTTTRATAEKAFHNIDQPLADGIERWKQAIAQSPNPNDLHMFSAHWELAQLAELRDELPLAAEQYAICRQLKPQLSEILIIQARIWKELNEHEKSHAALLVASRSHNSRTAEQALEAMGTRYPYPYEFIDALKLDPKNLDLHRELAYLYLAIHKEPEAEDQFQQILSIDPKDGQARNQLDALLAQRARTRAANQQKEPLLLGGALNTEPVLRGSPTGFKPRAQAETVTTGASAAVDARTMGVKSFSLGYMKDAVKYLSQAHEQNPNDAEVNLDLGWAYNGIKDDTTAIRYFDLARHADDPAIVAQATKAYHNLNGDATAQTTVWALPMFSTRWHDLFSYGQIKHTFPLPWKNANKLFSLYVSTRFIGDLKSSLDTHAVAPQYLSESSFIFGAGIATRSWHHIMGWAEAGEAVKYLPDRRDIGAAIPDYRGGVNYAKGFGHLLGNHNSGLFYETTADAIYVSRFDKDWLFYSQHRAGETVHKWGDTVQGLFNINFTHDMKNQYWANTLELGPGVKVHLSWMRPGVYFSADFLRGIYTNNAYNPRGPNYNDIRIGLWYAMTK